MIEENFDDIQELELADLPADNDDDSILNLLPQPRSNQWFHSNFNPAGQQWRLEDAARSVSMARQEIRRQAQEELERELELPPNWRERDRRKTLDRWHHKMALRAKAAGVPRCEHTFADGTRCGSPRLQPGRLCHAHELMERACPPRPNKPNAGSLGTPRKLHLLPMEDGNSIMLNVMEINRALLDQEITEQQARILLSSQQMGLRALPHVTFKFTAPERMLKEHAQRLIAEEEQQRREFAIDPRQAGTGAGRRTDIEESGHRAIGTSDHREEDQPATEHRRTQTAEASGDRKTREKHFTAGTAESAEEREFAADERRETQIRGRGFTAKYLKSAAEEESGSTAEGPESGKCALIPNSKDGQRFPSPAMTDESVVQRLPAV